MSVGERDPYTGHMTTGHEWNGIKELNTPVPRAVWYFLGAAFLVSVIYWVLLPAWPLGVTYTRGLLGIDERKELAATLQRATDENAPANEIAENSDFSVLQASADVMHLVRGTGRTLFLDNCSVCHGQGAKGGKGFPDLTDAAWLWGGEADAIMETLRVGINTAHEDTRLAQMPALGRDETLDRKAVTNVISFVHSLSRPDQATEDQKVSIAAGAEIFAENCAACHGDDALGEKDVGAPDLTDNFWIYGGDRQSMFDTIWKGRQGVMPAWETRLSELDRKILTLYLLDLKTRDGE